MKKVLLVILFLAFLNSAYSQSDKSVCITCDDLPFITKYYKDNNSGQYITDKLLEVFRNYKIIALGSVNAGKLFPNGLLDSARVKILEQWLEAGMVLANHTYAHKNYNKIFFSEFRNDVLDGEIILKELVESSGQGLKYFRHPHLYRGDTKEKADSLQAFLDSIGYIAAPVSIDNADYIFSWAYEKAKYDKNDSLAKRIGDDYVTYMEDVLRYYESQSVSVLGYNMKHILLMHANLINADYFEDVIKMYIRNGYGFITLDEALNDRCYKSKDEYYKKSGISWLHRWAYTAGKRGDFFKGEPEVPDYINAYLKN